MPPAKSGSQSCKESESSVIVGSGATMAACCVSSRMKNSVVEDKAGEDVCQHKS